ncbi:hypothetical protein C2G38_2202156 [Gigaspora rosea]|uniref:Uncharacterized protein n=1 Tax=Gigaspora rosea TaxID=44941 RepID=A0A397URD2_9GLOM|nr:hypothetical protein C2G38_2202156 [Gigaspora rosea]
MIEKYKDQIPLIGQAGPISYLVNFMKNIEKEVECILPFAIKVDTVFQDVKGHLPVLLVGVWLYCLQLPLFKSNQIAEPYSSSHIKRRYKIGASISSRKNSNNRGSKLLETQDLYFNSGYELKIRSNSKNGIELISKVSNNRGVRKPNRETIVSFEGEPSFSGFQERSKEIEVGNRFKVVKLYSSRKKYLIRRLRGSISNNDFWLAYPSLETLIIIKDIVIEVDLKSEQELLAIGSLVELTEQA